MSQDDLQGNSNNDNLWRFHVTSCDLNFTESGSTGSDNNNVFFNSILLAGCIEQPVIVALGRLVKKYNNVIFRNVPRIRFCFVNRYDSY